MFFVKSQDEKLAQAAPALLADEELGAVSGACHGRRRRHRRGHRDDGGGGLDLADLLGGSLGSFQTNVSGPVIQIAIGNLGDVTQIVSISQGNSASL